MSPSRSRAHPRPAAVDEAHLRSLGEALGACAPHRGEPAQVVRLVGPAGTTRLRPDDELELGLAPLPEGHHPADELAGLSAPENWLALGILATGRAWHVDGEDPSFRVRTVHLVARGGAWVSGFAADDPTADWAFHSGPTGSDGPCPPAGRLDDILRRALGEPTAPPPPDTGGLWATRWLDTLLADVAAEPSTRRRHRPLRALVAAHPAAAAFATDASTATLPHLVDLGNRLTSLRGWPQLRAACVDGRWPEPEVPPSLARWHDDGSFARSLLGAHPELADLHAALATLLAPAVLSVIDDALAAWGLTPPDRAGGDRPGP